MINVKLVGLTLLVAAAGCRPPPPAHPDLFRKGVIQIAAGVHVAVGYGLANVVLLQGTDGRVIVDTMESEEAARSVRRALEKIWHGPLRAIIYTHNHADHIFILFTK